MNRLNIEQRAKIIGCLVEGVSVRATSRLTGASKVTILKLIADLGEACKAHHDKVVRNLPCKRIQCDEIWSFVYAKAKNVPEEKQASEAGDVWTWVALDADTKLVPCWLVGKRDAGYAFQFMSDLAARL